MGSLTRIAALLGCLLATNIRAEDTSPEAPELAKDPATLTLRAECILAENSIHNQFTWILDNWITRRDSPWHIERNFKRLVKDNDQRFKQILAFAEFGKAQADSIDELKQNMRLLDKHRTDSLITFTAVGAANDDFESSLYAVEAAVADLLEELIPVRTKCKHSRSQLTKLRDYLEKYETVINTYRTYVYQSSIKVENVFLLLGELAKAELYQAYIKKTNERLEDVKRQIDDALLLDSIYGEFQVWWQHNIIRRGIGDDLHNKFLLFYEPRLKMAEQLVKSREFITRVEEEVKPHPSKDRILSEMRKASLLIQDELTSLTEKGWKGQRARQIEINNYLMQAVPSEFCRQRLDQHKSRAEAAATAVEFSLASTYFIAAKNVCEREASR